MNSESASKPVHVKLGPPALDPHRLARRRLVGKALAAPALATVCTGSAFGVPVPGMISATCIRRAQELPEPMAVPFKNDTIWIRVPTFRLEIGSTTGPPTFVTLVMRDSVTALGRGESFVFPLPGVPRDYLLLDGDGRLGAPYPVVDTALLVGYFPVLVRFDALGFVTGTGTIIDRGFGAIASAACLASLAPIP